MNCERRHLHMHVKFIKCFIQYKIVDNSKYLGYLLFINIKVNKYEGYLLTFRRVTFHFNELFFVLLFPIKIDYVQCNKFLGKRNLGYRSL